MTDTTLTPTTVSSPDSAKARHRAEALDVLNHTFGYEAFRADQAAIVETLIDGNNALVLMPTGGGKSLCYQIPALVRQGTGVVVSPLIALMQDQVDALRQQGVNAAFLNSTLSSEESRTIENSLLSGELDILYVAPERLLSDYTLGLLQRARLSLFAIDEAHCVSQWGHDFRPEYQSLSLLAEEFPQVPRVALTATADQRTRDEIIHNLRLEDAPHFIAGFDRPNIRYTISESKQGRDALWDFLETEHPADAGIVYCLSRKKVEETAKWLAGKGRHALAYHAGMDSSIRQIHQQQFLRQEGVIMVATVAFGMGIDKPDVRFVAHLNLPRSVESYYQETGRAGRDGYAANAWMHYGLQDVIQLSQMLQQSGAEDLQKRVEQQKLQAMLGLAELCTCRRVALLEYFGEQGHAACGNCDNCLDPPVTWDGTVAAQKALSCVYRTGQRFGVGYLIDVLLGNSNDRLVKMGHHKVSTFGIGTELGNAEWRSVFRQLLAMGYLYADPDQYNTLQLTEMSRPILRGEQQVEMRRPVATKRRSTKKSAAAADVSDTVLWEALRACRSMLASDAGVPPYVVFHDRTLVEMAERQPQTLEELSTVGGVGDTKLSRYGEEFLTVIREHLAHRTHP